MEVKGKITSLFIFHFRFAVLCSVDLIDIKDLSMYMVYACTFSKTLSKQKINLMTFSMPLVAF